MHLCAIAGLLWLATPASANDSGAALGAGGLVLRRTADIAMVEEQLEVHPVSVQVRYRFMNRGPTAVTTLVAFPLPEVPAEYVEDAGFSSRSDPANFVNFTVRVDGRDVTPRSELRAFVGAREVTAPLRALSVPVSIFDERLGPALEGLSPSGRAQLVAAGAIGPEAGAEPRWRMRAQLFWSQTFPAGRAVTVEHSYRPVAGSHFASAADVAMGALGLTYCLDPVARAALGRLAPDATVFVVRVDYILSTARNWAGPIGTFALTVDSRSPDRVATACLDGVRRISPQRLEARLTRFTPVRELLVAFLELPQADAIEGRPPGMFAIASQRRLDLNDVGSLPLAQLRLMRNEIYARHGYIFRNEALRRHFTAQPWYQPRHADVTAVLSDIERANLALIQERERVLAE